MKKIMCVCVYIYVCVCIYIYIYIYIYVYVIYIHDLVPLLYSRNWHNIVIKLNFTLKYIVHTKKKKKRQATPIFK